MIPKTFFVTSGKAVSPVSELNAFDLALKKAGIDQCNIVSVSSIIPKECSEGNYTKIPAGQITFTVIARMDGDEGSIISSGIAWARGLRGGYGLVAEHHGYTDKKRTKETLQWKIEEMAKLRRLKLGQIFYRIETLRVPMDNYGCSVVAFVYAEGEESESKV